MARKKKPAKNAVPPAGDIVSPSDALVSDGGDTTSRNYRYQHAYGVMLLASAKCGKRPYVAIWCEHHEDFLAEREDGRFNGYQIKTSKPEAGPWKLNDPDFVLTIGRFVDLVQEFGEKIGDLYFVSNTECDAAPKTQNNDRRRLSPVLFLKHIKECASSSDITEPFLTTFNDLQANCGCDAQVLFSVLKRVDLIRGPSRSDFDAVLSHEHLVQIDGYAKLPALQLDKIRNALVARVNQASSLQVTDPSRIT